MNSLESAVCGAAALIIGTNLDEASGVVKPVFPNRKDRRSAMIPADSSLLHLWRSARLKAATCALALFANMGLAFAHSGATELFAPPTVVPDPSPALDEYLSDPTIIRSRFVQIELESLAGPDEVLAEGDQGTNAVILNLFDDATYTAIRERVERRDPGRYTWFGSVESVADSQVILVIENGHVAGNIRVAGKLYQIRDFGTEQPAPAVIELDQSAFPDEMDPVVPQDMLNESRDVPAPGGRWIINVLVVFTDDVALLGNVQTNIQLAIDATNQSYLDSGVNQELRLVHAEQVSYTETGAVNLDLQRLRNPNDGFMDGVHDLRNTYRADLTSLLVTNGGNFCGIASLMATVSENFENAAFSVVAENCATANLSFAHELGHNMAARHDWTEDSTDNSPFTYNHGYVYVPGRWRTIMAYNTACGQANTTCTRIGRWSNPDGTYQSIATGVPVGSVQLQPTDNRMTLNMTAPTVANFRQNAFLLTANAQGTIDLRIDHGDGTFDQPIAVGANVGSNYAELAIADFTGDDELDFVAATTANPSELYLFTRTSPTTFDQTLVATLDPDPYSAAGQGLIAADLDNDGDTDFLENIHQEFNDGEDAWIARGNAHLNNGTGAFTKVPNAYTFASIFTGWTLGMSSNAVDLDGDGYPDLLASEQRAGSAVDSIVYVLRGNGDGTFQVPVKVFTSEGHPATYMTLGDFDNDGRVDTIVGQDDDGDPGAAYLFRGNGDGTFQQNSTEVTDTRGDIESGSDQPGHGKIQAYDANEDDILDLVSAAGQHGPLSGVPTISTLHVFLGNGDGSFDAPQTITTTLLTPTAFVTPLTGTLRTLINHRVTLDNAALDTSFDVAPDAAGDFVGTFTITATFQNTSGSPILAPFFRVSKLASVQAGDSGMKHALLNADGGITSQGEGAIVTPDLPNGRLEPGEKMTVTFVIGLYELQRFVFLVDLLVER